MASKRHGWLMMIVKSGWHVPSLRDLLIFGAAFVGLVTLVLSSRKDWFLVPVSTGKLVAETVQPSIVPVFQVGSALTVILLVASWLWTRSWNRLSVTFAALWLVLLLSFPYLVVVRDPPVAARATWLQMQHDNLTWLGGDINTSQEMSRYGWKSHVYVVDAPRQLAVIRLPNWSVNELDISRLSQLVEWLGYTNAFCQFVSKGWYLACFGSVAMLASTFFVRRNLETRQVGFAVVLLPCLLLVYCLAAWSFPFRASQHLTNSANSCVVGEYDSSLAALRRAGEVLPIICEHTHFVAQRGLLERRLGIASEFSLLYEANLLEREGLFQQALHLYRESTHSPNGAIQREATRALLRYAVHAINSGSNKEATELLQETLRLEPCNLKAIYMLQIVALRTDDEPSLNHSIEQMYEICEHLRFPTKRVLLATSQQHAMYAAMLNGDVKSASARASKMKRP